MKRLVTIQSHEGEIAVVEQFTIPEVFNDPDGHEEWVWEANDRALLKETGHVDIARLKLEYDNIEWAVEIGTPLHGIESHEVYLLDGPLAGQKVSISYYAHEVGALHGSNIERYVIKKYRDVRVGVHDRTEQAYGGPGWVPFAN
jgi:hypothetical protein